MSRFINHKGVPVIMNYKLNIQDAHNQKTSLMQAVKKMLPLMQEEKKNIIIGFIAIIINSALNLIGPIMVGIAIDKYVLTKNYLGILLFSGILLILYLGGFGTSYLQTKVMGTVGQNVLFNLRNAIFIKLQELPVAFFNQNKVGDLISRINNDTDKLNQFFSQSLMQFIGNVFIIIGAGIFILAINIRLGVVSLLPAAFLLIVTQVLSGWIKRKNFTSLQTTGGMSAEIQESLNNFKVIVAFNRRDYFRDRFSEVNRKNFKANVSSGIANNIFTPIYSFASNIAQLIVLAYGIYLIINGNFTVGLLISYLAYISRFYDPLRQMASLWSSFQLALASWDRVSEILALQSDMEVLTDGKAEKTNSILTFNNVFFHYPDGKEVLKDITFDLEKGKTYALVGPTGGGKTTTASLMARLYDPTKGKVLLDGRDIRSYTTAERTKKIGFILQEPFLFSGTVKENLLYGNEKYKTFSNEQMMQILKESGLDGLLKRFENGLDTQVSGAGDSLSLGQRQLIAFIRAVLRNPELLILDEATANIDTVTEKLLEEILTKLPKETTRVIIAHRLNTIENADEIFFVNSGEITRAGSLKHAMSMLLEEKRAS